MSEETKEQTLQTPQTPAGEEQAEEKGGGTLQSVAQEILSDTEYRKSLLTRARSGKLTPMESRWLFEQGTAPQEAKAEPWETMLDNASEDDLNLLASLLRRGKKEKKVKRVTKKRVPKKGRVPENGTAKPKKAKTAGKLRDRERKGTKRVTTKQVLSSPTPPVGQSGVE